LYTPVDHRTHSLGEAEKLLRLFRRRFALW
jgi:hypothetical protein